MILRQLHYLDALARERHFRRAAEACHVTQPTLSAALHQLEEELGVLIVERGRSFKRFTREGELVLVHARRILSEAERMRQSLSELQQGLTGRLRIGAVPTALPLIGHIVRPFADRFPQVALTVLSLTSDEIQRRLNDFELDAGLTYLDNEPLERAIVRPIYHESYVLLTEENGPLAHRQHIRWDEAASLRLCMLTSDMQNRRIIDGIFRSVGCCPQPALETNSIFHLCSHASVRDMCSIVSRQLLDAFGLPKGTKALPLIDPEARRSVGLVVADRQPLSPLTRNLLMLTNPLEFQSIRL